MSQNEKDTQEKTCSNKCEEISYWQFDNGNLDHTDQSTWDWSTIKCFECGSGKPDEETIKDIKECTHNWEKEEDDDEDSNSDVVYNCNDCFLKITEERGCRICHEKPSHCCDDEEESTCSCVTFFPVEDADEFAIDFAVHLDEFDWSKLVKKLFSRDEEGDRTKRALAAFFNDYADADMLNWVIEEAKKNLPDSVNNSNKRRKMDEDASENDEKEEQTAKKDDE